ncbi:MAG: ECF transporter S component [Actinomycetota bacterium]|nr:ECF transporter S component [Actinomycetota bacterium]
MKKQNLALFLFLLFISFIILSEILDLGIIKNWGLMSLIIVFLILVFHYARFEDSHADSKVIAMIAAIAALSIGGRILFTPIPSLQPSTFMIIAGGYVFGPIEGFMIGSTTALVSNFFLGHGPWTPWQMLAWGLAGLSAGVLGKRDLLPGKLRLTIFCAIWGFLYGWILNAYFVLGFIHPISFRAFASACVSSFWFDLIHSLGNAAFALIAGPAVIQILSRFKKRFFFQHAMALEAGNNEGGALCPDR